MQKGDYLKWQATDEKAVVLIVDDASVNVRALQHILKDEYHIKTASGGVEALACIAQEPNLDLILLDVSMPDIGGYDLCKKLKDDPKTADIPIIFLTGKDSSADEEHGLSLGAVDYITKPIRPVIVKARIKTHVTLKRQYDLLRAMATRDALTGLHNRHYLSDALKGKISQAIRSETPLSLMIIDIDHFKQVNDTYGHLVGDIVLTSVAKVLLEQVRADDIAARFGGEEFVVVLENCGIHDACIKAEKIRSIIENLHPEGIRVSASFGVVQLSHHINCSSKLLNHADKALYQAKESGRNKVVVCREKTSKVSRTLG